MTTWALVSLTRAPALLCYQHYVIDCYILVRYMGSLQPPDLSNLCNIHIEVMFGFIPDHLSLVTFRVSY